MPNTNEGYPETKGNLQFPGGDISESNAKVGDLLLKSLTSSDPELQYSNLRNIRRMEMLCWRSIPGQDMIWNNMQNLSVNWGTTTMPAYENKGPLIMRLGMEYSISFLNKSHILPVRFNDFSDVLENIKNYDREEQKFFANEAWSCMRLSHSRLFGIMATYAKLIANEYGFIEEAYDDEDYLNKHEDKDELILLDAGFTIPYLMASATRMSGYLKNDLNKLGPVITK